MSTARQEDHEAPLRGRTAVVTGGTRGLGLAMARSLLEAGASVVCAARSSGDVQQLINDAPGRVLFHSTDVTSEKSVSELFERTHEVFGGPDIVVSNAAVRHDARVEKITIEQWDETLRVGLTGVFLVTRAATPYLIARGGGKIINVSSGMATRVGVGASAYSATKAGVEMFTRSCAIELGRHGITVNCISPGLFSLGMGERLQENERVWEAYRSRIAEGRIGDGQDIGRAIRYLATDASSYVNGHVLEVNGGFAD
jgi:3-oxoacyl-[acyl-carrier protein] reductase